MTHQVSANRICDLTQICVLCGSNFLDLFDEELEMCSSCSEGDQVDPFPEDPTPEEIEQRKAEIRATRPQERIVTGREDELEHRRALRRIKSLPSMVESRDGALPKKRKPERKQQEMF
jgi:hypothetical protein